MIVASIVVVRTLPGASGVARAAGAPDVAAALVRYAFSLEKDALLHRDKQSAEAKQELATSADALRRAIAVAPPAAVLALRQALAKDEDASSLLSTPNGAKVRLDVATALNRKEAALGSMGAKLAGPVVPPSVVKPLPKVPSQPKKPRQADRAKIADLVRGAPRASTARSATSTTSRRSSRATGRSAWRSTI